MNSVHLNTLSEVPSPEAKEKLKDLQFRFCVILTADGDLKERLLKVHKHMCFLFVDAWSFLADLASTHGGTDTPIDEEIDLLGTVLAALEAEDKVARTLLVKALLSEDVRGDSRHANFCPHPWIELGLFLFPGDARAAWAAYTRRVHVPACRLNE